MFKRTPVSNLATVITVFIILMSCNLEAGDAAGGADINSSASWLKKFWGYASSDHIYLGMWTWHFDYDPDNEWRNQLIGGSYQGYFSGTFKNTYGDRTWTAGVQRTLYQGRWQSLKIEAGYRAGMMYGYKKNLQLFGTPWFPLAQAIVDIDYKGFGIELSWAGVILGGGVFYRF